MKGKATANLNVRKNAGVSYTIVKTLSKGTVINILSNKKVGVTTWYKIDNNQWVSGKYVNIINDENKNEITVTPNMSISKIQECLKESGCTIRFTKGTYKITKTLKIYSNTTIVLDKDAVLIRKNSKQIFTNYLHPKKNYSYNATKNVTIKGKGKLIGNGHTGTCSDISIMHCKDFTIEGITFDKTYKSHAIDICGCDTVTIKNVTFKDRIVNKSKTHKEEVNLDFSFYSGFPYYPKGSPCFNNNHCKNIVFDNVKFDNVNVCIGSHTESNSSNKHKNIVIKDCTAKGYVVGGEGIFGKFINVDGLTIANCNLNGFERDVVLDAYDKYYDTKGRKTTSITKGKTGCENVEIKNNICKNAKGKVKAAGIYITSQSGVRHKNINIIDNKFALNNMYAKYDIYISNAEGVDIKGNNTKLEIKIDKNTTDNVKVR